MRTVPHVARCDVHCQHPAPGPRATGYDCHSHRLFDPPSPALPGFRNRDPGRRHPAAGVRGYRDADAGLAGCVVVTELGGVRRRQVVLQNQGPPAARRDGATARRRVGKTGRCRRHQRRPGCRSCCEDCRGRSPGRRGRRRPAGQAPARIAGPRHDNAPRGVSRQGATMRTVPHVARSDVHCQHRLSRRHTPARRCHSNSHSGPWARTNPATGAALTSSVHPPCPCAQRAGTDQQKSHRIEKRSVKMLRI